MKLIQVDFRRRQSAHLHRRLAVAGWSAFAASVMVTITLYGLLKAKELEASPPITSAVNVGAQFDRTFQEPTYEKSAREALRLAASTWPQALVSLEAASMDGISIRSLEAVPAQRVIRIEVTAENLAQLNRYVGRLNEQSAEFGWVLKSVEGDSNITPSSSNRSHRTGTLEGRI